MKILAVLFLSILSLSLMGAEKIRYDNFHIYRVNVGNEKQLSFLKDLQKIDKRYTYLEPSLLVDRPVPILVPPTLTDTFMDLMKSNDFDFKLVNSNIQKSIDAEIANAPKELEWTAYHTLEEINVWIDDMVDRHPEMTVEEIGRSYEDRPIRLIKISKKAGNPGIFIETHIHAREWITSATVTWLIEEMFTSTNPDVMEIFENYDWYIVPVLNVDGFAFTEDDRLWRKTRSLQADGCIGVDANRNFGYNWMAEGGASDDPCDITFAGTEPYSEREVRALIDYYVTITNKIDLYLSFHSYGQYLLIPHGTGIRVSNFDHLMQIGNAAAAALRAVSGTEYTVGNTAEVLYVAAGTSPDWAYGAAGTKLAYTYEFRDLGETFFELPPDQIIPNAMEVRDSLVALLREAKTLGYMPRRD